MTPERDPTHSPPSSVPDHGGGGEARARGGVDPPRREELLRVRARDPDALGRFFDLYFPQVYGLVKRLLGNRTAAEDAAQEVFLKVHRAIDRLDPDRDPGPWLTTIAYNVCRDLWRSSGERMQRSSSSIDDRPELSRRLLDEGRRPDEDLLAGERERLVQEAIDRLPEQQREVIVLHDYHGLTHEQVAELVGASHAAVRKRHSRAVAALGEILRKTLR